LGRPLLPPRIGPDLAEKGKDLAWGKRKAGSIAGLPHERQKYMIVRSLNKKPSIHLHVSSASGKGGDTCKEIKGRGSSAELTLSLWERLEKSCSGFENSLKGRHKKKRRTAS